MRLRSIGLRIRRFHKDTGRTQTSLCMWHSQFNFPYQNLTFCFITCYTECSGLWNGTSIILVSVFFLCLVTDISATVAPISVKFCMNVHIGLGQIFSPFGGGSPRDPQNPKFSPSKKANILKTVSRSITC